MSASMEIVKIMLAATALFLRQSDSSPAATLLIDGREKCDEACKFVEPSFVSRKLVDCQPPFASNINPVKAKKCKRLNREIMENTTKCLACSSVSTAPPPPKLNSIQPSHGSNPKHDGYPEAELKPDLTKVEIEHVKPNAESNNGQGQPSTDKSEPEPIIITEEAVQEPLIETGEIVPETVEVLDASKAEPLVVEIVPVITEFDMETMDAGVKPKDDLVSNEHETRPILEPKVEPAMDAGVKPKDDLVSNEHETRPILEPKVEPAMDNSQREQTIVEAAETMDRSPETSEEVSRKFMKHHFHRHR